MQNLIKPTKNGDLQPALGPQPSKLGAATGEAKDDEGMARLAQLENFPLMFFKHITNYDKISHCIILPQIKTFGKYAPGSYFRKISLRLPSQLSVSITLCEHNFQEFCLKESFTS